MWLVLLELLWLLGGQCHTAGGPLHLIKLLPGPPVLVAIGKDPRPDAGGQRSASLTAGPPSSSQAGAWLHRAGLFLRPSELCPPCVLRQESGHSVQPHL